MASLSTLAVCKSSIKTLCSPSKSSMICFSLVIALSFASILPYKAPILASKALLSALFFSFYSIYFLQSSLRTSTSALRASTSSDYSSFSFLSVFISASTLANFCFFRSMAISVSLIVFCSSSILTWLYFN